MIFVSNAPAIADWVSQKLGVPIFPPFTSLGWIDKDKIVAGFVFNSYVPNGNIEMTVALGAPLSRGMLNAIAHYVFVQLKCSRLSIKTKRSNKPVCDLAKRLGFSYEATLKAYFGSDDAVLFRMLRADCRWLKE